MSWFEKIVPSRIKTERRSRSVPEGLWIKCPACDAVLYRAELERNLNVCPKCSHHMRIGARERLRALPGPGTDRRNRRRRHAGRSAQVQGQQALQGSAGAGAEGHPREAMRWWRWPGSCTAKPVVACAFEFQFLGGSMGSVVGERFRRAVDHCIDQRCRWCASPPPAARACRRRCCRCCRWPRPARRWRGWRGGPAVHFGA